MGWTRKANPKWQRKASRQTYPSIHYMSVFTDRFGNQKPNKWDESWVSNSRWYQRYTAHQQRACNKHIISYELYEYEQWQDELWDQYTEENWYDDEPMEYREEEELDWIDWEDDDWNYPDPDWNWDPDYDSY